MRLATNSECRQVTSSWEREMAGIAPLMDRNRIRLARTRPLAREHVIHVL